MRSPQKIKNCSSAGLKKETNFTIQTYLTITEDVRLLSANHRRSFEGLRLFSKNLTTVAARRQEWAEKNSSFADNYFTLKIRVPSYLDRFVLRI